MVDFSTYNIKGGLNLKDRPAMLDETEFSELTNYYVENGVLNVREGYAKGSSMPNATGIHGLYEYVDNTTPANNTMLYATSTTLKNTAGTTLDSGISGSNYINFSKFSNNESLYYVDGVSAVKSVYTSSNIYSASSTILSVTSIPYMYTSGGESYMLSTDTTRKIAKLKLINGEWTFEKFVSTETSSGNYWHSFCFDGTYYYGISSVADAYAVFDENANLITTLTITAGSYSHTARNRSIYDSASSTIFNMSSASYPNGVISKIHTTTGFVESYAPTAGTLTLTSLFIMDNVLYYTTSYTGTVVSKIYLSGIFTLGDVIALNTKYGGSLIKLPNNIILVSNNYIYILDNNFTLQEVSVYNAFSSSVCTDGTIDDIYIVPLGNILLYKKAISKVAKTYNQIIFDNLKLSATSSPVGITPFRIGTWYFAYTIATYDSVLGDYDYSILSTPVNINLTAASNITLTIDGLTINAPNFIKFYGRHETESYFYEIAVADTNTATIQNTLFINEDAIYDETTVYSPPPVACTQLTSYRDMMVYVKANALYFTNYFDPINVPSTIVTDTASGLGGYYPVGKDNANITAIYQFHGYLFVFKEHSTYRITGDPGDLSTFRIDLMSSIVGAKNERCITDDGRFMYVFNDTGIYPINEVAVGQSISEKIDKEIIPLYTTNTSMCYHKKLNRVMLISNAYNFGDALRTYNASVAYVLTIASNTWSKFSAMPGGIPIMLNKLGNDLHIEDNYIYKMFSAYNDDGNIAGFTAIFTTKRHTTPSTTVYKRLYECDIETDGDAGMTFSSTTGIKSQAIIDGSPLADSSVAIYPGTASIRQKLRVAFNNCNNYALRVIASISGSNTVPHSIQSIMWRIRQKSGVR